MEQEAVTTIEVEAHLSCAPSIFDSFAGIGTIEHQPHFVPVTRRALMAAVNTTGRALGLRPPSVVVLDALLSCLPCNDPKTGNDSPITPLTLLTVFACNDTLCFRAKGITDRQLRRHLEKLEAANLIQRRDSANGKRFPIMRNGKVIGAFGIDLSPLLARSGEILALSQKHRQEADELRGMKAYIQKLRGECLSLCLHGETLEFVEAARNFMRRTGVTVLQASSVISRLKCILQSKVVTPSVPHLEELATANDLQHEQRQEQAPPSNSNKPTASDGQNVRHKETQKSYTKKTFPRTMTELWACLTEIPAFYPDYPTTEHGLLQLLFEFGKMLRIDSALLGRAVSVLGLEKAIQVADQMACKIDQVKSPDNYLSRILAGCAKTRVGHGQLCVGT
ncbi:helix-turn-helix domain-containing protein [Gemmobacter caeruleus]|jgi:replication initiation protein RepC|uniref:helix-turn-helix domain-containing protein n=1 Tax=Gemmobacter caeruleus TaxID=2595004 RepID=UPI001EF138D5|nr:helix-turn-helix domain-containing protein [Gemmobacter caeruleus]